MNPATKKLFVTELKRQWNLVALLAPLLFLVIGSLIILTPSRFIRTFDISDKLIQSTTFLLPIITALFSIGLVSNDVKDGWLRTLLVRAIKRQHYLFVRMLSVLVSTWASLLFAVVLPLILGTLLTGNKIEFDALEVVFLLLLYIGVSLTYLTILTFLSCWLPGVFNIAVLMVWGLLATAAHYYVGFALWNKPWAVVLEPFIFPSGFFDAIDAVNHHTHTPYSEILWGLAAVCFFLGLSFWSVTRIQVDRGSE